jgi:internalin A
MCGKLRGRMARVMLVGMMLCVARVFLAAQEPPEQEAKPVAQAPAEQKPTPLPEAIEKAWAAAGAEIGWMRIDVRMYGPMRLTFVPRDKGQKGDIPAFRLQAWQAGLLPKLPEPELRYGLDLTKLPLTDRWLVDLRGLKNLQALNLARRQITGVGLKELAVLENLQWLSLDFTQVTDAGLKELAELKNLQWLDLAVTKITDAGLKELAVLKNLQWLNLGSTKITDAGLKELAALKNLRELELGGPPRGRPGATPVPITDAGVEELKKALPDCKIWR